VFKKHVREEAAKEKGKAPQVASQSRDSDSSDGAQAFQNGERMIEHMFGGSASYESKRQYKTVAREVLSSVPSPRQAVKWSDVEVIFNQSDCPANVIRPGRFPIVVEPTINNCQVSRVLMDGGSSLNILFSGALDAMQVPRSAIKPVSQAFHGIVPGSSATPIGQVTLPVTFGTPENFRTEKILFDVVDFETAYNAILGRPTLARFMAVVHYAYQCVKIPGTRGVIRVRGCAESGLRCDKRSLDMATLQPDPETKVSKPKVTVKSHGEVKSVLLDEKEPSKAVRIGSSLNKK
jgi:hypothetical protein